VCSDAVSVKALLILILSINQIGKKPPRPSPPEEEEEREKTRGET